MLNKKLQQVRDMTQKISEFVEVLNIQGCNELLTQRLKLLKNIEQEVNLSGDKLLLGEFQSLMTWLQGIDSNSREKSIQLKKLYQEKLTKQKKANSAIASYQKNL